MSVRIVAPHATIFIELLKMIKIANYINATIII